jgi:type I restriction enzyme S subunit
MTNLPTGWYEEPLNKFVDARSGNGKLIKGKLSVTKSEGLFPAFSASGQDIWTENAEVSGPGIVVSAVGARCGKSFLTDGNWTAVANTHILQIKKDAPLDIKYLWYLCNDENWWIRSGTAQPFVKVKDTLERPQLLPPIHVQYKIVEILEDHLSRLDAALADVKQAKLKAGQFRRSFLQAAFTGNLSGEGTRLMKPVTEWQTKTVGELADTQLGKMLNKGKQSGKHAKPYLRTDNVHWGSFDLSEIKKMDILPDEETKYIATRGDLLMCEGGAAGRTAIWNEDYDISFQNHVHRIRPKNLKEITPKYLLYFFEWFIKNGFAKDLIKGVTISSLSQSGLRSIAVNYPPLPEQQKIVELLEGHLSRLDASVAIADEMEKQSASLRRSLLQAAFTGQLTKEVASV